MAELKIDVELKLTCSAYDKNANRIARMTDWLPEAEAARAKSSCADTMSQSRAFNKAVSSYGFSQ